MSKKSSQSPPPSIEEIDELAAAIAAELAASEKAQATVSRLEQEEDAALIAGDTERKLKIRAQLADAEDEIRRAALVLPGLRQRHEAAKRARAEFESARDIAAYQAAVASFAAALGPIFTAIDEVDLALARARATCGEYHAAALPLPPRLASGAFVFDPQLLGKWLDAVKRMGVVEAPPAPPRPGPTVVHVVPKVPAPPPEPPRFILATKPPAPDADGRAVVVILAAHPANSQLRQNDLVRLPHKQAMALVRGGVAEFVEPTSLAEPPRELSSVYDDHDEGAAA